MTSVLPGLHEAKDINACLERVFRHFSPDVCEVLVVDGDQAFFMSKVYFRQTGGFAEIPIMEDLDLMRRIKQRDNGI